jgi:hypothetical protein
VVHFANDDEARGLGIRQGPKKQSVDGAQDGGGGTNPESEGERRRQGEPRTFSEEPEPKPRSR